MSDTREEITLEEMPEVRLRGGQVVTWAVVVMVMVLLSFFFGYYSGRSAERQHRSVRGETVSRLLKKLEVYSEENRRMIAKERLTAATRTAMNVRELPAQGNDQARPRVEVVRSAGRSTRASLAVSRTARRGRVIRLSTRRAATRRAAARQRATRQRASRRAATRQRANRRAANRRATMRQRASRRTANRRDWHLKNRRASRRAVARR